jgi:hypothetical protein
MTAFVAKKVGGLMSEMFLLQALKRCEPHKAAREPIRGSQSWKEFSKILIRLVTWRQKAVGEVSSSPFSPRSKQDVCPQSTLQQGVGPASCEKVSKKAHVSIPELAGDKCAMSFPDRNFEVKKAHV